MNCKTSDSAASKQTLAVLGEAAVLAEILPLLPIADGASVGPGDDAAVLLTASGHAVLTTDTMIQGPDFRLAWSSPYDLGYKAAITNLSDVASMGAKPTALLIALACPGEFTLSYLQEFARGISKCLREHAPGCGVIGGDLTRSEIFSIAVTAIGEPKGKPVLRSGAKVGDLLAVAGVLGQAAAGVKLLYQYASLADEPDADAAKQVQAKYPVVVRQQLQPSTPINLAVKAGSVAHAMMDISDGLAQDSRRLAHASQVRLQLDYAALQAEASALAELVPEFADQALELVVTGGEDHGFLATFAPGELPQGFRVIGKVTEGSGVWLNDKQLDQIGWDAFKLWDGRR